MNISQEQLIICNKYGILPFDTSFNSIIGISENVKDKNIFPINGLRHNVDEITSGWYIWAGLEFSYESDFFKPLHIEHLLDWRPDILKYLALPPGYRFLIGEDNYEDVWFDKNLLNI